MAKKYDNDKGFLIIEMSYDEVKVIGFGCVTGETERIIVCDNCNNKFENTDNIYYFAALNRVLCKECTDDIIANQKRYEEDIPYEKRYYDHYAKLLNLEQV